MILADVITELEKRRDEQMKYYEDTDDVQSQGIALGLDEAIVQLKRYLEDD